MKIDIGFLTVIVGETGTGKSCIAKRMFKNAPAGCVLDIQQEYDLPSLLDCKGYVPKFSIHPADYELEDLVRITELSKGFTFLLEESTGVIDTDFFKSKLGKRLVKSIVAKRHIQRDVGGGNNWILIFHSTKSIPSQLWGFIDFLFVFPLGELEGVKNKDIEKAVLQLSENNNLKIDWETWQISDFKLIFRTSLSKDNEWYVQDYLNKRLI